MRQSDKLTKTNKCLETIDPNPYDVCDIEKAKTCKKTRCKALTGVDRDCYQTTNPLWRKDKEKCKE